jgi:hypothetical protein
MASKLTCVRCGGDPSGGAAVTWSGPATGHNTRRRVLCEECERILVFFCEPLQHVNASDPVTAMGLAHIAICPECSAQFGPDRFRPVLRDDDPVTINKRRVADRFARGGQAQ